MPFKKPISGMSGTIAAGMQVRAIAIAIKEERKYNKDFFYLNRKKECHREGLRQQEDNKPQNPIQQAKE